MKFLVDQNLPSAMITRLVAEGHETQHTRDLGFERTSDEELFEWCRQTDSVLLTADKRLTKYLAEQRATSPSSAVLDSTVLIDFLRGRPAVSRVHGLRMSGAVPATTAVNVEEIVRGLRPREHTALQALVSGLLVIPIDTEVAQIAGTWRREYAVRGITLWQADCLIAAAAQNHGALLCTGTRRPSRCWT